MSQSERFDDDRIESLLVDFFRAEMPEEFRDEPVDEVRPAAPVARPSTAPRTAAPRTAAPVATRRGANGLVGLVIAGACLAVLFIATNIVRGPSPTSSPGDPDSVADAGPTAAAADDRPVFHLSEEDLFVESVEGHVENLAGERFDTERGPVELRAVRETTNVSAFDPSSGIGVDLETQILDIEIVPIDPEAPNDEPTPRDDDPALPESDVDR